jgi:hypothetical protein
MADKVRVTTSGFVFGNCWGGGTCGYKAKTIEGSSLKEVKASAKVMLESGSLDGGMGYESLYGAYLLAKIETIKVIDEKEFIHTEYVPFKIGKVSKKEREAAEEVL